MNEGYIVSYDIDYYTIINFLSIKNIINIMYLNKTICNLVKHLKFYKELQSIDKNEVKGHESANVLIYNYGMFCMK